MPSFPRFVVDTSVALKWFVEIGEKHVPAARALRDSFCEGRCALTAPDLLLTELANALTTGHRTGVEKVREAIRSVLNLAIPWVEFDAATLEKAVELSASYGVTVYDTYFWAVAIASRSSLVTADERFLRKVGHQSNVVSLDQLRLADKQA